MGSRGDLEAVRNSRQEVWEVASDPTATPVLNLGPPAPGVGQCMSAICSKRPKAAGPVSATLGRSVGLRRRGAALHREHNLKLETLPATSNAGWEDAACHQGGLAREAQHV